MQLCCLQAAQYAELSFDHVDHLSECINASLSLSMFYYLQSFENLIEVALLV